MIDCAFSSRWVRLFSTPIEPMVFKGLCLSFQEFLHVSPTSEFAASEAGTHLLALTHKLSGCVNQLEQFPVRVHDLPAPAGTSGASGGYFRSGTSALRFFNTHQLKCNLQWHPACNYVKQWKGGNSDDTNNEDDVDDSINQTKSVRHKLQILVNDHAIPYNMTVYQAIRQFSKRIGRQGTAIQFLTLCFLIRYRPIDD